MKKIFQYGAQAVLLALVYAASGKLGLSLASLHKNVSLIWPPSGIALASLLILGEYFWPAIFLGAFLVNDWTHVGLAASLGIAAGNTLEALVGSLLLRRVVGFQNPMERLKDVLGLIFLSGVLSTAVSATVGVANLCLGKSAPWNLFGALWLQWWSGDALGILIVAAFLLAWIGNPRQEEKISFDTRGLSGILLFVMLLAVLIETIFGSWGGRLHIKHVTFFIFPFLMWAAIRFGPRGATLATLVISSFAVWTTSQGTGPFIRETPEEGLVFLMLFMATSASTGLILAATSRMMKTSEEKFRVLVESSPAGIVGVDLDGFIVYFNSHAEEMFRYDRAEVIGRSIEALLPERFRAIHGKHRMGYLANPEKRQMGVGRDLMARRKDGSEFPVEVGLGPIVMRGESLVMAFIIDITERKKSEEELLRLSEIKSEFASMVSHELRTPLSSIKEGIEIVLDGIEGPVTAGQKETLSVAKNNVGRLARLINNVLDYAKLESGKMEPLFEQTNMTALVQEIYDLMKFAAQSRKIAFKFEAPEETVPCVCDVDKIKQLMINLVDNAIKFTDEGGTITLRLERMNDWIHLEVEDNGAGIAREDQARIFEMFGQAIPRRKSRRHGSGIGLAICKLIVDMHRGQIIVESSPGKGSRFKVLIPTRL